MMLHFMFFSARKVVVGVCALIALFALGGCTSNDPLTILGPWSDECNCHSICFHSDGMFYYESDCDSTPYVFCAGRWKMKDDKVCLSSLDSLDFSISISGDKLLLRNGGYESRLIRSGSLSCGTHPIVVDDTLSVPMGVLKCNDLQGALQDLLKQRNYYNVPNSFDCLFVHIEGNSACLQFEAKTSIDRNITAYNYLDGCFIIFECKPSLLDLNFNQSKKFYIYSVNEEDDSVPAINDEEWFVTYHVENDKVEERVRSLWLTEEYKNTALKAEKEE